MFQRAIISYLFLVFYIYWNVNKQIEKNCIENKISKTDRSEKRPQSTQKIGTDERLDIRREKKRSQKKQRKNEEGIGLKMAHGELPWKQKNDGGQQEKNSRKQIKPVSRTDFF